MFHNLWHVLHCTCELTSKLLAHSHALFFQSCRSGLRFWALGGRAVLRKQSRLWRFMRPLVHFSELLLPLHLLLLLELAQALDSVIQTHWWCWEVGLLFPLILWQVHLNPWHQLLHARVRLHRLRLDLRCDYGLAELGGQSGNRFGVLPLLFMLGRSFAWLLLFPRELVVELFNQGAWELRKLLFLTLSKHALALLLSPGL